MSLADTALPSTRPDAAASVGAWHVPRFRNAAVLEG